MEVSGEIGVFEGQRACAPLQRHLLGWRRFTVWIFVAAILAFDFGANPILDQLAPGWGSLLIVIVSIAGFVLMLRTSQKLMPRAWARRGVPASSVVTYRIESHALILLSSHAETRLTWSWVSEIIPGSAAWLFIGQGAAYFLPRRLFADPVAERAFLTACLDHMTPEARALSIDARRVATAN